MLGTGGMGSVYLAAHPRLPRKIALKLLHRSLTDDRYARVQFEREADHAARLDHPNIVSVLDRGIEGDQLWIAMQFVPGTNAAKARERGRMAPSQVVRIVGEIAMALEYAHENGVLHRDVKPANMLLEDGRSGRPGRVLLADFGIAKAFAETSLTKTGMLAASLHYAAPEQFDGAVLDDRADVYSLGCSLFHLLTGRPPYPGNSLPELMRAHLDGAIPMPSHSDPDLPVEFDRVIERAMAKDRDDRYPSCAALADDAAAAAVGPRRHAETVRAQISPPTSPGVDPVEPVGAARTASRSAGPNRRQLATIAFGLAALVAVVVAVTLFLTSGTEQSPTGSTRQTTLLGADGAQYTVSDSLFDKYDAATMDAKKALGPPLSAEKTNPDGKYQWFVGGVIIEKVGGRAHIVWGEIRNKWNELGGSQGALGYPTSDEFEIDGSKVSTFEKGTIVFKDGVAKVDLN